MRRVIGGDDIEAGVALGAQSFERVGLDEFDAPRVGPFPKVFARLRQHFGRGIDREEMETGVLGEQGQRADAGAAADFEAPQRCAGPGRREMIRQFAGQRRGVGADEPQHLIFPPDWSGEQVFVLNRRHVCLF